MIRVDNYRFNFVSLTKTYCVGTQLNHSFEHPKLMLKLMNKKLFTILGSKILLILTYVSDFRKIVEHVDWMTSAEQMAEYIKAFRYSEIIVVLLYFFTQNKTIIFLI